MFSPARPRVTWSMVAIALAPKAGVTSGTDGGENGDLLRYGTQRGAVGERLEGAAIDVGLALVAAPFRHRQDELHAGVIGDPGHRHDVVPVGSPSLGCEAHGQAAVAVRAEDAQLESVRPEQRVSAAGVVHA